MLLFRKLQRGRMEPIHPSLASFSALLWDGPFITPAVHTGHRFGVGHVDWRIHGRDPSVRLEFLRAVFATAVREATELLHCNGSGERASLCGSIPPVGHDWRHDCFDHGTLETFKAAELTLACACPKWHRFLRQIYNRWGMPLARRIQSPWIADLIYVSLKPAEWLAAGLLFLLLGSRRSEVRLLYWNRTK